MKKSILNLGKALNKVEQKEINGGRMQCWNGIICTSRGRHCAEIQCQLMPF